MEQEGDFDIQEAVMSLLDSIQTGKIEKFQACLDEYGPESREACEAAIVEHTLPDLSTDCVSILHVIALKGQVEMFTTLLNCIPTFRIDVPSVKYQWTPLHCSVAVGDLTLTPVLLDCGASLNAATTDQETPLHIALRMRQLEMADCLIEVESDINEKDAKGNTPLHVCLAMAAQLSEQSTQLRGVIEHLVKKGCSVNVSNSNGDTPVHICCRHTMLSEVLRLLLRCGATGALQTPNKQGHVPVHIAQQPEILRKLSKVSGPEALNAKANDGSTPLHVHSGNPDNVQILLDAGADPDLVDLHGRMALHASVAHAVPSVEAVQLLLTRTKDINIQDQAGHSAVHVLCGTGHECELGEYQSNKKCLSQTLIRMFVDHGADINAQSKKGSTPLHHALKLRHYHAADTLLALGADANQADCRGRTPKIMDSRWYDRHRPPTKRARSAKRIAGNDDLTIAKLDMENVAAAWSETNVSPEKKPEEMDNPRALSRQLTTLQADMQEIKDVLEELDSEMSPVDEPNKDFKSSSPVPNLASSLNELKGEVASLTRSLTRLVIKTDD